MTEQKKTDDATADAPSFGEALADLEAIVARLEGGQLELEASITEYERGVGLIRRLQTQLADAELKVTELLGEIEDRDDGVPTAASATSAATSAYAPPAGSSVEVLTEDIPF
ncbi:MAG: exodeoxyribonuclease VII small subunit [Actinomycetes bacterium]|jgi:exodeoxyribonuclease VII small subunit|nr:exodeoxyribonuclease VII small subunit [Actinomycetes bacterium]